MDTLKDLAQWQPGMPYSGHIFLPDGATPESLRNKVDRFPDIHRNWRQRAQRLFDADEEERKRILGKHSVGPESVECAALWNYLDEDPVNFKKLLSILETLFKASHWNDGLQERLNRRMDLQLAHTGEALAMVLDLLEDRLPEDIREELVEQLGRRIIRVFRKVSDEVREYWTLATGNWPILIAGRVGRIAMTLGPSRCPEYDLTLAECLRHVERSMTQAWDDGGWREGMIYWNVSMAQSLLFFDSLRRLTGYAVDGLNRPFYRNASQFALAHLDGTGLLFNWADCRLGGMNPTAPALMASILCDELAQWIFLNKANHSDPRGSVAAFIFADPNLVPKPPEDRSATVAFRSVGLASSRSGWKSNDLYLGVRCGPTIGPHQHLDGGNFVLSVGGQRFVDELGYWSEDGTNFWDIKTGRRWDWDANATRGHSTLLVDGQDQVFGQENAPSYTSVGESKGCGYLCCDLTPAYRGLATRTRRCFIRVENDLVIIVDDLESDCPRRWEWLLVPRGETHETETGLKIVKGQDSVDFMFLHPTLAEGRIVSKIQRHFRYPGLYDIADHRSEVWSVAPHLKRKTARFVVVAGIESLVQTEPRVQWQFEDGEEEIRFRIDGGIKTIKVRPKEGVVTIDGK